MDGILVTILLLALLAFAIVAGLWVLKSYMNGQSPTAALFGPKPEPRLGVVEQASVDGRRRLLLIRRDGVEHLIMTGGPVDVVIETGIGEIKGRADAIEAPATAAAATAVFSRPPRQFGQATPAQDRAAE